MRIGITGITGLIGAEVARHARAAGHTVIGFSRSTPEGSNAALAEEWRRVHFPNPLDVDELDAVVHLAGESIMGLWSPPKKRRILGSRIDGTRAVVTGIAAAKSPPSVLISGSAIGIYGDTGEHVATETSPAGAGFLAEVAQAWEAEAARCEQARVVLLRTGFVIAPDGGAMQLLKPVFRAGLGGPVGTGRQWMSCIHVADVAGMILHGITDAQVVGPINAVLPEPVRNRDFTKAAGRAAHRPAILPVPTLALKVALGQLSELLLDSQRVVPEQARATGYSWRHATIDAALRDAFR